ncbi:MAG: helix-turn-helix transcriptional regulator [Pseudomonadota bacterium]|nr:helix-turn-helix transcriptional regulator [Pseudomonadota bacterium]
MTHVAEPITWKQFFAIQRSVLQQATAPGEPAEDLKLDTFSQLAQQFCPRLGIAQLTWDIQADADEWARVATWPASPLRSATAPRMVAIDEAGRAHRFSVQLETHANAVDPDMIMGVCSTLKMAVELHGQVEMLLADARTGGEDLGHASVDQDGHVLFANARFQQLIQRVEPDWDGRRLPMPLDTSPNVLRHGMTWKGLFFYVQPNSAHIQLRVRPDRRLPDLSPRELEVARLIASGMTFKEVARELDMAPSTASTHLYKVYDKLGISRRSALVEWLKENADALNRPRQTTARAS